MTQIIRDFIGQHLHKPNTKEMWCVTTIRPGRNMPAETGSAARATAMRNRIMGSSLTVEQAWE